MEQTRAERLHIIEGGPWKDAVISLLDNRCRYRPWRFGFGEAQMGDPVAIVLDTDPPSIITELATLGADGRFDRALVRWPSDGPGVIDLNTLAIVGRYREHDPRWQWQLRGDDAVQLEAVLRECAYRNGPWMRLGHSPIVQARILLHSQGRCTGCEDDIDLVAPNARDVYVHTVDELPRDDCEPVVRTEAYASYQYDGIPDSCWIPEIPADWPGVMCARCRTVMVDEGYTSLLDFRFARHPKCPRCRAERTQRAAYGMPSSPYFPPWVDQRGCVVRDEGEWSCLMCGLRW
jgi:hypothetical protein